LSQIGELHLNAAVKALTFSPDGKFVFAGYAGNNDEVGVNIWDIETGFLVRIIKLEGRFLEDFSINPEGQVLAIVSLGNSPSLWDVSTGSQLAFSNGHEELPLISVSYNPVGKSIAYGYAMLGFLDVWNIEENKLMYEVRADTHDVNTISYTLDGQKIISGGWEGTVRIWNANNGALIREINIQSEPKTEDGKSYVNVYTIKQIITNINDQMAIAGCALECIVQVRDINSGKLFQQLTINTANWDLNKHAIAYNPDGTILGITSCLEISSSSTCTKTQLALLDMNSFTQITKLIDTGEIIAFGPNKRIIATGAEDGSVYLFGVANP
jgi:WD40 repeat protein